LVCFKREDGSFELLDGQQRHTTLTLLNLVLKNWDTTDIQDIVVEPNLRFDSRKKSQQYLESLYKVIKKEDFNEKINDLNVAGTGNFKDAIEIIQEELRNKDVSKFATNFYNHTFLFRIEVPEDTDLNHYFEIMNSRGEQLEKHEIVKALLMGDLDRQNKEKEQNIFAVIWDACSDMSDYVYFNFDKTTRQKLFDNEGGLKNSTFSELLNTDEDTTDKEKSENSLSDILSSNYLPTDFPKEEKYSKDKYKSIIDFPNFLLQVLKLKYNDIKLDDKKLLEQFNQKELNPEEFIFDLLKYRALFDKYIIKQDLSDADENKQNWGIRKLNPDFENTIKTFQNDDDDELVKLQTMLYCANSTNTYNNWLQEILKEEKYADSATFTKQVFEIALKRFDKDKDKGEYKLSYPDISIFSLYFIDFLLWKIYKQKYETVDESLTSLKEKIKKNKDLFNSFKFKQITSREHLAAQSNPSSGSIPPEDLNGIGNLCLISTSQNSAGNKESPADKKKRFANDNESLKRIIMFESFEDGKWETEQIENHKKEIDRLINLCASSTSSTPTPATAN
jgi:hypothetical protein